jgi:hypothetical protein
MEKYSLSDIAALMGNRTDNGFLGGNSLLIILFFFLAFSGGFGGGFFGGNGASAALNGALTRADLSDGLNNQTVLNKLNGLENGLSSGFYSQNTTALQGFSTIGNQIGQTGYMIQNGFCNTNHNIDNIRYDAAQNTCRITTNATANTQAILDKLCQMESNAKDQRILDLTAQNQTQAFQLSQQNQNAVLISTLRPTPIPAYTVPYYGYGYGYQGCGCN